MSESEKGIAKADSELPNSYLPQFPPLHPNIKHSPYDRAEGTEQSIRLEEIEEFLPRRINYKPVAWNPINQHFTSVFKIAIGIP